MISIKNFSCRHIREKTLTAYVPKTSYLTAKMYTNVVDTVTLFAVGGVLICWKWLKLTLYSSFPLETA